MTRTDYEEPTEYFNDTESMGGIAPGDYLDYAWSGYCSESEPVQIVDPWHQGQSPVSALHPRQPIAGLSPDKYGCIHATWYTNESLAQLETITDWVQKEFNTNGITVYYDIRSVIQDKYESGGCWNPGYILTYFLNDLNLGIDLYRLDNTVHGGNLTYNKWVKDW